MVISQADSNYFHSHTFFLPHHKQLSSAAASKNMISLDRQGIHLRSPLVHQMLSQRFFHPGQESGQKPIGDDPSEHPWKIASNPAFTLMLDGHFYLEDAFTLEPETNLQRLLKKISTSNIEAGLHSIRGGLFNLVILDNEHQKMVICGDPSGSLPLYYLEDPAGFHVSATPSGLGESLAVSEIAVVEFLKYGYLPFSHSLFENVHRLLPGQIISVSLGDHTVERSSPSVFEFKPLNHRMTDLRKASERLHLALKQYFARFTPEVYLLEGTSPETTLLRLWLERKAIPVEAPSPHVSSHIENSDHHSHRAARNRLLISREYAPSFLPNDEQTTGKYISDFPGNALLGDLFFNDISQRPIAERMAYLWKELNWNRRIRDIPFYQEYLYQLPGALPDNQLTGILQPDHEVWLLNEARGVLEINRDAGHVHEDFLESLKFYTMGRSLLNIKPVLCSDHRLCAMPFLDYEVQQACLDTDKKLRVDHRLLSFYLESYFDKKNHSTILNQSLSNSVLPRIKKMFSSDQEHFRFGTAVPGSVSDEISKTSPETFVEQLPSQLARIIGEPALAQARTKTLHPLLWQRLISLAEYFSF